MSKQKISYGKAKKMGFFPAVTVDVIIFTIKENDLKVLLVKRNSKPFKDCLSLPGGFFKEEETLIEAAKRKLFEKTSVKDVYLEQLYSFDNPKRDPRGRIITIAYFALINSKSIKTNAVAVGAELFSIKSIPKLAFDHNAILNYALQRLRWKLEYTNIAYSLLPEKFTLSELQETYEIILGKKFDKRNFRKKIFSLNILADAKEIKKGVSHRPAKLFSFKKREPEIIKIL